MAGINIDIQKIHADAQVTCHSTEKIPKTERMSSLTGVYTSYWLKKKEIPGYLFKNILKSINPTTEEISKCQENAQLAITEINKAINLELENAKRIAEERNKIPENGIPTINVAQKNDQLNGITDRCIETINKVYNRPDKKIFVRMGKLTAITSKEANKIGSQSAEIVPLDKYHVRNVLCQSARFIKYVAGATEGTYIEENARLPIDVCENILADLKISEKFPILLGIVEAPYITGDGTVVSEPGYNDHTKLFFAAQPDSRCITIPEMPTPEEVDLSVKHIDRLLTDFQFDNESSRENVFGAILTAILRPNILGPVPMYAVDKPVQRIGGTLICEIVHILATGRPLSTDDAPNYTNEDEWSKLIISILQKGTPIVCWDNLTGVVKSKSLAMTITSETRGGRTLGKTENKDYPVNVFFLANGVNITFGGDIPVRVFVTRILSDTDRPQDRTDFLIPNIKKHILENRYDYIRDVLIIAKAYHNAGYPAPDAKIPAMGGFEAWQKYIAGIMTYVGKNNFLGNYDTTLENVGSVVNEEDKNLVKALCISFADESSKGQTKGQTKEFTVGKILEGSSLHDSLPSYIRNPEPGQSQPILLGTKLRHLTDTPYSIDDMKVKLCVTRRTSHREKFYVVMWVKQIDHFALPNL